MVLKPEHQKLLEERGLDVEICVRHSWTSSEKLGPDTIAIPYIEEGEVKNTKYRSISGEKKFCQEEGGKCLFWNVDVISDDTLKDQPLYCVEGEMDAIALIQAGYPRVVSVPNGAPKEPLGELTTTKYAYLDNAPSALRDVKEIVLCTDGDTPGIALRDDLAVRLGRARCKYVRYPRETKDLNEVLVRYGVKGIHETIRRAQWIAVDGVFRLSELPPLNTPVPHRSGFPGLDDHYRLRIGDFCVCAGVPSSGKTSVTRQLACEMARRYEWRTVMASFEAIPQLDHRRALRTWFNRKLVKDQSSTEIANADAWIDEHFRFIVPKEDDDVSIDWLIERISAAAIRDAVKLVIVDPYNELDHHYPPGMSETEYVGETIRRFKRMIRKFGLHMILVAHPRKMERKKDGEYPTPTLYDISGSAMFYNKADVGVIVSRGNGNLTLVDVQKSRFHDEIGKPGEVQLRYEFNEGTFKLA